MTVAAPTDVFQGDSVAAVDISTAVHSSPPRRQRISATAALRKSFSAVVNASRPFPTNPSARSPKGFMLYNASSRGHTHLVREYILGEVDVDWQDDLGFSSLLVASKKGHSQVVEVLLAAGASPNLSCVWGDTPLFVAAVAGHRCCMQLLLAKGADLYHRNRKNKTVADVIVDELQRNIRGPYRLKLGVCLELVIATHSRAVLGAEAHANVVDIEGAAAVVINPGFELHVVGSQLIPTSSRRSDLSI